VLGLADRLMVMTKPTGHFTTFLFSKYTYKLSILSALDIPRAVVKTRQFGAEPKGVL
jgi:hypothetical protein